MIAIQYKSNKVQSFLLMPLTMMLCDTKREIAGKVGQYADVRDQCGIC